MRRRSGPSAGSGTPSSSSSSASRRSGPEGFSADSSDTANDATDSTKSPAVGGPAPARDHCDIGPSSRPAGSGELNGGMERPAVVAEGLVKHFGGVHALDGVDLSVPAGSVLGLLGPNGAGKTTAVRILTTILRPDRGRAEVLGTDVIAHPQRVRSSIGLAGQYAAVDENLTGRENLILVGRLTHLPRAEITRRAEELLVRFDLEDAA